MYGDLKPEDLDQKRISERLRAFATTAFRRPLRPGELAPFESLAHEKLRNGMEPLTALQLGFQTILSSPAFLFCMKARALWTIILWLPGYPIFYGLLCQMMNCYHLLNRKN